MGQCCSNKISLKNEELVEPRILPPKDFNLPAIVIQKYVRGFITRKKLSQTRVGDSSRKSSLIKSIQALEGLQVEIIQDGQLKLIKQAGTILQEMPQEKWHIWKDYSLTFNHFNFKQVNSDIDEVIVQPGPVKLNDGNIYLGQWLNGKKHGKGIQLGVDNSCYYGEWKNGCASGKGVLVHDNGDRYEGYWENGKALGKGKYTTQQVTYEGEWLNDKQHGFGKETWHTGDVFEGEYNQGVKSGQGKFVWNDGSSYIGYFLNNNMHGEGTYYWSDGRMYSGHWLDNMRDGYGEFTWPDGRSYKGEFKADMKHGQGVLEWPDGRVYQGSWKDNVQHGEGKYINVLGIVRKGKWVQGKRVQWEKGLGRSIISEQ